MELIETPASLATEPLAREMTKLERVVSRTKYWLMRQRRKLPYLVWWNDEVDVIVTLTQDKLPEIAFKDGDPINALRPLFSGAFYEAAR